MTYRGTLPTGQAFHGQQPGQQYPAYQPYPSANEYATGMPQYQDAQYYAPSFTPQPGTFHPSQMPQQPSQFVSYDDAFERLPSQTALPVQFVDPAYLQQNVSPMHVYQPLPVPRPVPPATQFPQHVRPIQSNQNNLVPDQRQRPSPVTLPNVEKGSRRSSGGSAVAKSPVVSSASPHVETLPLLLCVAEDCFSKANNGARDVAGTMSAAGCAEYHRLVSTGLRCLEVAMQSNKLWPRLEARLRLRYANILVEETNNLMEAETALTKGIAVCDKHRFTDLKYCSQFVLMKALFQRSPKAAFKSIDGHIAESTTFKHIHWVYAFRLLKAAFYLQTGAASDHHALENLRDMALIAQKREDNAIYIVATLLEALAILRTMKDDTIERVQTCIAKAAKLQLDESSHVPQIDIILLLLNLACSLQQKEFTAAQQKLDALRNRMKELRGSADWDRLTHELVLPIKKQTSPSQTISNDTRAILRPGDGDYDYLVLSTMGNRESFALANVLRGLVELYKATTPGGSISLWNEAVRLLDDNKSFQIPCSLPEAVKMRDWDTELSCYTRVLIGFQAATMSDWAKVKECLKKIEVARPPTGFLDNLVLYLSGVFWQGTANLGKASKIWQDERFSIALDGTPKSKAGNIGIDLSILATFNQIWIMQEPSQDDCQKTAQLLERLRPLCESNPDQEIRSAYYLVCAAIPVNGPNPINQIKAYLHHSLVGFKQMGNKMCLAMALNLMRYHLFEGVVGEQAVKSARAGVKQAQNSGNILWMSVADGMLSQSLEMLGQEEEARAARETGIRLANKAFARTQC